MKLLKILVSMAVIMTTAGAITFSGQNIAGNVISTDDSGTKIATFSLESDNQPITSDDFAVSMGSDYASIIGGWWQEGGIDEDYFRAMTSFHDISEGQILDLYTVATLFGAGLVILDQEVGQDDWGPWAWQKSRIDKVMQKEGEGTLTTQSTITNTQSLNAMVSGSVKYSNDVGFGYLDAEQAAMVANVPGYDPAGIASQKIDGGAADQTTVTLPNLNEVITPSDASLIEDQFTSSVKASADSYDNNGRTSANVFVGNGQIGFDRLDDPYGASIYQMAATGTLPDMYLPSLSDLGMPIPDALYYQEYYEVNFANHNFYLGGAAAGTAAVSASNCATVLDNYLSQAYEYDSLLLGNYARASATWSEPVDGGYLVKEYSHVLSDDELGGIAVAHQGNLGNGVYFTEKVNMA